MESFKLRSLSSFNHNESYETYIRTNSLSDFTQFICETQFVKKQQMVF